MAYPKNFSRDAKDHPENGPIGEGGPIGPWGPGAPPASYRLALVLEQLRLLYYEVVPNAHRCGHPGPRGSRGAPFVDQKPSDEVMKLNEIKDTLKAIRPHIK